MLLVVKSVLINQQYSAFRKRKRKPWSGHESTLKSTKVTSVSDGAME